MARHWPAFACVSLLVALGGCIDVPAHNDTEPGGSAPTAPPEVTPIEGESVPMMDGAIFSNATWPVSFKDTQMFLCRTLFPPAGLRVGHVAEVEMQFWFREPGYYAGLTVIPPSNVRLLLDNTTFPTDGQSKGSIRFHVVPTELGTTGFGLTPHSRGTDWSTCWSGSSRIVRDGDTGWAAEYHPNFACRIEPPLLGLVVGQNFTMTVEANHLYRHTERFWVELGPNITHVRGNLSAEGRFPEGQARIQFTIQPQTAGFHWMESWLNGPYEKTMCRGFGFVVH